MYYLILQFETHYNFNYKVIKCYTKMQVINAVNAYLNENFTDYESLYCATGELPFWIFRSIKDCLGFCVNNLPDIDYYNFLTALLDALE